jgi:hypothetical protein
MTLYQLKIFAGVLATAYLNDAKRIHVRQVPATCEVLKKGLRIAEDRRGPRRFCLCVGESSCCLHRRLG